MRLDSIVVDARQRAGAQPRVDDDPVQAHVPTSRDIARAGAMWIAEGQAPSLVMRSAMRLTDGGDLRVASHIAP